MKPDNSKPRDGCPLPPPCKWCGGQLTKGRCVPCAVEAIYYVNLLLEHYREEKQKHFSLTRLKFAVAGAKRFLPGFDVTPIEQAIEAAATPRGGVQADNKEKVNG